MSILDWNNNDDVLLMVQKNGLLLENASIKLQNNISYYLIISLMFN
jgi:hypothetical protein